HEHGGEGCCGGKGNGGRGLPTKTKREIKKGGAPRFFSPKKSGGGVFSPGGFWGGVFLFLGGFWGKKGKKKM
ncbi:hypothetical protein, partial [Escherichia coli]|uniref:hypothetical protein n=1 Tax=Escherichia coli TaxID=562 RepID=UPI001BC84EF0